MHKILVIDDDRTVCKSLELLLKKSGYDCKSLYQPVIALDLIKEWKPDLVLLDMNFRIDTSGKQGLAMLRNIKDQFPETIVILITGWATLQLAVEGMKLGAKDFLAKPWDNKHLLASIKTSLSLYATPQEESQGDESDEGGHIIGQSPAFLEVLKIVDTVSKTDASVLITGESGSGKEIIAEAIHQRSQRYKSPFVKVNLGGISTSLFESEMFGHVKGAFTDANADREGRFARAHTGTIFLDEIGDLALESQVKLLRVLQEKSYEILGSSQTVKTDVRVISATHRPLEEMVSDSTFREDLFYRINLIQIHLPSLSERSSDIPLLVKHFVKQVCNSYGIESPKIKGEAMEWLTHQTYAGNIRQLRNIVERTVLLSQGKNNLDIKDFQANMVRMKRSVDKISLPNIGEMTLDELESSMIKKALKYHNQSISQTARSLGLTRSSLYRRMEKYGIK